NLDYVVARKPFKIGSRSDDVIFASFIDLKIKKLQLIACLDKPELVTIWSTSLDEPASTNSDGQYEVSQVNVTFTHPKNKQSITLQLYEHIDEAEKSSFLSTRLRSEQQNLYSSYSGHVLL
ncbi:unnamed protein product, partial [Rotaria magnacalcarata]